MSGWTCGVRVCERGWPRTVPEGGNSPVPASAAVAGCPLNPESDPGLRPDQPSSKPLQHQQQKPGEGYRGRLLSCVSWQALLYLVSRPGLGGARRRHDTGAQTFDCTQPVRCWGRRRPSWRAVTAPALLVSSPGREWLALWHALRWPGCARRRDAARDSRLGCLPASEDGEGEGGGW